MFSLPFFRFFLSLAIPPQVPLYGGVAQSAGVVYHTKPLVKCGFQCGGFRHIVPFFMKEGGNRGAVG